MEIAEFSRIQRRLSLPALGATASESSEKQCLHIQGLIETRHCLTEDGQAVARLSVHPLFPRKKSCVAQRGKNGDF